MAASVSATVAPRVSPVRPPTAARDQKLTIAVVAAATATQIAPSTTPLQASATTIALTVANASDSGPGAKPAPSPSVRAAGVATPCTIARNGTGSSSAAIAQGPARDAGLFERRKARGQPPRRGDQGKGEQGAGRLAEPQPQVEQRLQAELGEQQVVTRLGRAMAGDRR